MYNPLKQRVPNQLFVVSMASLFRASIHFIVIASHGRVSARLYSSTLATVCTVASIWNSTVDYYYSTSRSSLQVRGSDDESHRQNHFGGRRK